ncbi:NUDIX hydrolase [Blautia liquoris]|uniref:NUDIX hydrolase n=1 Tax=Blautia liquoris TaxID=2779518 RepID=A0A7M2RK83_9FIRM|nr:NUDIX hydrolase [Blautia liquoris]QOV20679.1 NUDIX hydrolase [Blautia liquoris]
MNGKTLMNYQRVLALAEAGLYYGKDDFDKERYQELKDISLDLISEISSSSVEKLENLFIEDEGYPTPKIDVRAYIQYNNKILLVEDSKTKEWALPGGYAEVGLSPKENIIKEVFEETGMNVTADHLLAVFDTNKRKDIPQIFQFYKMVFSCTIIDGTFQDNLETSDSRFFRLCDIPKLSEQRTTNKQLEILKNRSTTYFE